MLFARFWPYFSSRDSVDDELSYRLQWEWQLALLSFRPCCRQMVARISLPVRDCCSFSTPSSVSPGWMVHFYMLQRSLRFVPELLAQHWVLLATGYSVSLWSWRSQSPLRTLAGRPTSATRFLMRYLCLSSTSFLWRRSSGRSEELDVIFATPGDPVKNEKRLPKDISIEAAKAALGLDTASE